MHEGVQGVAAAPLGPSFIFQCPIVKTGSTATLTHFVIPLLTTEFSVDVDKNGGKKKKNT